jgi:hypothetical protein
MCGRDGCFLHNFSTHPDYELSYGTPLHLLREILLHTFQVGTHSYDLLPDAVYKLKVR